MPAISGSGGGGGGGITQVSSTILGVSAASFDISAIPGTFNHLLLMLVGRSDTAATSTGVTLKLNNDGTASYDSENTNANNVSLAATAASAGTSKTVGGIPAANATANSFGGLQLYIPFYANTSIFKTILGTDATFSTLGTVGTYGQDLIGGLWRNTAAINRVTLTPGAGNFVAGSALSIYGIT